MRNKTLITFFRGKLEADFGIVRLLENKGHIVRTIEDPAHFFSDDSLDESDLVLVQTEGEILTSVIESLNSAWLSPFTPVLLILANPSSELRVLALERVASDILSIPFSEEEFLSRVNSLLRVKLLYDELEKESIELQHSHAEVKSEKMQMEAMLEAMGDGVILVTNEGVVRKVNGSAKRMLGLGPEERITAETTARCRFDVAALLRHALSGMGSADPVEVSVESSAPAYLLARFSPVKDHLDRTVGRMVVLTDVTNDRVAELNKARFVMEISHELRTPLTSLTNALTILSTMALPHGHAERRKFLDMALTNVKRMASLIMKLVDYSRMGASTGAESTGSADIVKVVGEVVEWARNECGRKEVEIIPYFHCDSVFVSGDAGQIKSSIRELVEVAVKMLRAGETMGIAVKTEDRPLAGQSTVVVELCASDSTGVAGLAGLAGINVPDTGDRTAITATTSLACSIARRMIEMQKGSVTLVDRSDGTASFEIRFPVAANAQQAEVPAVA